MTLKEKQFIKITAKTLNPSEAVRRVYDIGSKNGSKDKIKRINTIKSRASENMSKPDIQKGLRECLKEKFNNTNRSELIKRNAKQKKNLPASNQALDMLNKIHGDYAPEKKITLNITPDNINRLITDKFDELKQLQQEG